MLKNIRKRILDSLYKNEVDLTNTKRTLKLNDLVEIYKIWFLFKKKFKMVTNL